MIQSFQIKSPDPKTARGGVDDFKTSTMTVEELAEPKGPHKNSTISGRVRRIKFNCTASIMRYFLNASGIREQESKYQIQERWNSNNQDCKRWGSRIQEPLHVNQKLKHCAGAILRWATSIGHSTCTAKRISAGVIVGKIRRLSPRAHLS